MKANVTIYAHWEKNAEEKVQLSFDTQGGNVLKSVSYVKGATASVLPTPVRAGYDFLGWTIEKTGDKYVKSVKMDADTTLYAQWKEQDAKKIVTVTSILKSKKPASLI